LICRRISARRDADQRTPRARLHRGLDVNVDELETGVVDQAAPRGVREDGEEVVVVLAEMLGPR
jgi:hypothetical protein